MLYPMCNNNSLGKTSSWIFRYTTLQDKLVKWVTSDAGQLLTKDKEQVGDITRSLQREVLNNIELEISGSLWIEYHQTIHKASQWKAVIGCALLPNPKDWAYLSRNPYDGFHCIATFCFLRYFDLFPVQYSTAEGIITQQASTVPPSQLSSCPFTPVSRWITFILVSLNVFG